jgi:O2-independent ubiquinone biosynthesis accessory factor UbiT
MRTERFALMRTRLLIDRIDGALLLLFAARRRLALQARACKQSARLPLSDAVREHDVRLRAQHIARDLGVPSDTARALADLAIADARLSQGIAPDLNQGDEAGARGMIRIAMEYSNHTSQPRGPRWLRLLPPPARWAVALRALPPALQRSLMESAMARALAAPLESGALAFLQGRRLGIDVTDLDLHWVITLDRNRLRAISQPAEASVRGTATDLLLLAARLEDADTLFFQRRLVLTGDTELGLTARNLLDRLPWEQVPLALRILLNRGARFAQSARSAHRDAHPQAHA